MSLVPDKHGRQLVRKFEAAAIDYAFKGTAMPEEHYEIEQAYQKAKTRLINYLDKKALDLHDAVERMRLDR